MMAQPLQSGWSRGMCIIDSLSLSRFLDCCFGMSVGILFGGISAGISAPMRSLFCLFHVVSPCGGCFIEDGHAAIFPLTMVV